MPIKKIELSGIYKGKEIIKLSNGKVLKLSKLINDVDVQCVPLGSKIDISITYNDTDFLNGSNGIVWATYSEFQAETIKNALLVQNILSEIKISNIENKKLYLIFIQNKEEVENAIDFIWRDETGLKLKLDWYYSTNKKNESFNKWLRST